MKFTKKKYSTLAGPTQVEYTLEGGHAPFGIFADSDGVWFVGESPRFRTPNDMEMLARTVGSAATDYMALKPKLVTTPGG